MDIRHRLVRLGFLRKERDINMNTQVGIRRMFVTALIAATAAIWAQEPRGIQQTETDDLSLGERMWSPVSNGIVFIGGKYVPPPYIISRKENHILVNGQDFLRSVVIWPPIKIPPPPPPPETEPVVPASITEKTTKYDKELWVYISATKDYLLAKHGQEKTTEMMVDVYRRLPCVKSAQREGISHFIDVIWVNDAKDSSRQTPAPRKPEEKWTKEQAKASVDEVAEGLVESFTEGGYYMSSGRTPCRSGTIVGARRTFLPIADAIRVTESEEDFLAVMKTNRPIEKGGMPEDYLRTLYKHKDEMPVWEARIHALKSGNGQ